MSSAERVYKPPGNLADGTETGIRFEQANLRSDDIDATDQIVFTSFCLEQLKYDTAAVLSRIHSWRPRRVIHYASVIELCRRWIPSEMLNILYLKHADCQDSLLRTLREMEKTGQVRIIQARRAGYGGKPIHQSSFIAWEPIGV